jgi:YD repeat-containing protein
MFEVPGIGALSSSTTTRRDALGRVTAVVEPDGATTTYAYDANDKVTQGSKQTREVPGAREGRKPE